MKLSAFLVKWRTLLFALMTALAVVCACFIPRLNIIMEVSYFLPDDSPMKMSLEKVKDKFPDIDIESRMVNVMLEDVSNPDSTAAELSRFAAGMFLSGSKQSGNYTLYQYLPQKETDVRAVKKEIEQYYGDRVTVELDIDKNMPANIIPMILSGVALALLVLLIMCASFMEVLLFVISMGIAILINMGSNILMDGVSFMTNTMVAVLQMILSMDYSIILANRYRQEKLLRATNQDAMTYAISGSASSILSSAFTTIVSLMMLIFMRLKLGADLGFVLAKGVFVSLICNFTVLPFLILTFDKAITATSKKTPNLQFRTLSRLQMKFRIPLTVLFVAVFVSAAILQTRTPVAFSAVWPTPINEVFPHENRIVLLYDNSDESAVPYIMDTLDRDPMVESTLNYPGLMLRGYTASQMAERYGSLSPLINEDMLRIIYYAKANPKRTERLSIQEIEDISGELAAQGLIPDGMDTASLMEKLTPPSPGPQKQVQPEEPVQPAATDPATAPADTVAAVEHVSDTLPPAAPDSVAVAPAAPEPQEDTLFTYEFATRQMTARQMADFIQVDRSLANTLFRMAGRTRKPATMSPYEASSFIVNKILPDKRYSRYIDARTAEQIRDVHSKLEAAFIAGPPTTREDIPGIPLDPSATLASQDSLGHHDAADSTALAIVPPAEPAPAPEEEEEDDYQRPSPLERLAEMAFSGKRYSASQVRSALGAAGVSVSKEDMDLLYLYAGSRKFYDPGITMSPAELIDFVFDTILTDPSYDRFIDSATRESLSEARSLLGAGVGMLRSDDCSIAIATTDYEFESQQTFDFLDRFQALSDRSLKNPGVLIGESVMYKEFKDDFPSELKLLTILTVAAIFLIVLITFRSLVIPILLLITVMTGVYVDVFVSGLGGGTMYFVAYLVVQSILMGATIDYSILFTSYYREERLQHGIASSLAGSFRRAGHSILTSGLIVTIAPFVMSLLISDQMIAMILKSLSMGALAAISLILLVQPGVIATFDRLIALKGSAPKDAA